MQLNPADRYLRQLDILKPDVCKEKINIIGAGATGSFTALALAKMGCENIKIWDGDTVEEHNFPNQLFPLQMKGNNKAIGVKELVKGFTEANIEAIPQMYKDEVLEGIVISALDTMKGRKLVFNQAKKSGKVKLLLDSRTAPEMFRLFTVNMELKATRNRYEETLHTDTEALDLPCTARAIIYSVLLVSGYISNQIKRYLMKQDYKWDMYVDLANHFQYSK